MINSLGASGNPKNNNVAWRDNTDVAESKAVAMGDAPQNRGLVGIESHLGKLQD